MDAFLKQSTAVSIVIGPMVDSVDGSSIESGLTISQADVRLSKNAAAFAQKGDATSCTHMENGLYSCPLSTTDTATLGRLTVVVNETGALITRHTYMVVSANVWDSLFGTDLLDVNAVEWAGSATATSDIALKATLAKTTDITGFNDVSTADVNAQCDLALTDIHLDHLIAVADPGSVVANSSFLAKLVSKSATPAFTSYTPTTDSLEAIADAAGGGGAPTAAAIADAVWDEVRSGHTTSGTFGQGSASVQGSVTGSVASVTANVTVAALAAAAQAEVNAQVVDALNVDTYAEPGQGAPAATTTIRLMLQHLYKGFRNKTTAEATAVKIFGDDATTVHHTRTVSTSGGITTLGEISSGP